MICQKCGNQFPDGARLCKVCGQDVVSQADKQTGLLVEIAYKRNGKSCCFYTDHMEFGGHVIQYADIDSMEYAASKSRISAIIIWTAFFLGIVSFKLKNGKKVKIITFGFSLWSIGTAKSAAKRFEPMFGAIYLIVAKAMAACALARINKGETVNIAGLEINREGATYKKFFSKKPVYISKQNFGSVGLCAYYLGIYDKAGKALALLSTQLRASNLLLAPYVLYALFGTEENEDENIKTLLKSD